LSSEVVARKDGGDAGSEPHQLSQITASLAYTSELSLNALAPEKEDQKGKIIEDENEEEISVTYSSYREYFMGYYGGYAFLFLSQLGSVVFLATLLANNYIIGEWSRSTDQQGTFKYYACMTYAMVVA
jgi:hypothetical protein